VVARLDEVEPYDDIDLLDAGAAEERGGLVEE
jgi:hypothetical protein